MRNRTFCRLIFAVLVAIFSVNPAMAQLAYSPLTEGSVAFIALTGPEINFARGNPATLAARRPHTLFVYSMENNQNNFDSPFRGFGLQVAVNSCLTLGIGRWERTATTGAVAARFFSNDPLRWIGFGYRQDWSAGLGLRLDRHFTFGASIRKEQYTASSSEENSYVAKTLPYPGRIFSGLAILYCRAKFGSAGVHQNRRRGFFG